MIFNTQSGSIYETSEEHKSFRKLSGDGLWYSYASIGEVVVGKSATIVFKGFDEHGNAATMITSPVVSVSEGVN